ncbi:nucleoside phosphorylase [Alteromonas sp. A079]|uniref:phosphorylase family protein n=1 Tax=Alteromonas sp. A079 TaxID=3410268 RepID=UPI003BA07A08
MKVLILEDNNKKFEHIKNTLSNDIPDCQITRSTCISQFVSEVNRNQFDLVVTDLMVPLQVDTTDVINATEEIICEIRDTQSLNFSTPVIAITLYSDVASENFERFNRLDITIVNYSADSTEWSEAFLLKARKSIPRKTYDFVIFCALEKEASAFVDLGYSVSNTFISSGLKCRSIDISGKRGVIVIPPRMGLVNAAITSAKAIDVFAPNVICMSGICAGIEGKANIYDVIVSDICHQHDSGKWSEAGFTPEHYSVQIPHTTRMNIEHAIQDSNFVRKIKDGISLKRTEFPSHTDTLTFEVKLAATSSGSSVVASDEALLTIREQHRKMTSFEMESYGMYEAARQADRDLSYFSAKAVVDNGNEEKSDDFHRVACLLSAKTVYELLSKIA